MKYYHIDRAKSLREGMTLTLPAFGLSAHGNHYWGRIPADDNDHFTSAVIEHIFEEVRLAEFSHRPSRFISLFGCISEENLSQWKQTLTSDSLIWEIEAASAFIADASLLRCLVSGPDRVYFAPDLALTCARAYWQGATIEDLSDVLRSLYGDPNLTFVTEMEALIQFPAKVIRRVL